MNKLRTIPVTLSAVALASAGLVGVASTTANAGAKPSISVSRATHIKAGSKITIKGSGFPKKTLIYVVECKDKKRADCNVAGLAKATSSASGRFTLKIKILAKWTRGKKGIIVASNASQTASASHAITLK